MPDPFHQVRTVAALPVALPVRGVGPAEAKQGVLGAIERNVVGVHLEREDRDVRVEEKIDADVLDVVELRRLARIEDDAHTRHIVTAEHADTALRRRIRRFLPRGGAVEETLHVR